VRCDYNFGVDFDVADEFQSTHLREVRPFVLNVGGVVRLFQSTHLREVRLIPCEHIMAVKSFQSTHLREVRR